MCLRETVRRLAQDDPDLVTLDLCGNFQGPRIEAAGARATYLIILCSGFSVILTQRLITISLMRMLVRRVLVSFS